VLDLRWHRARLHRAQPADRGRIPVAGAAIAGGAMSILYDTPGPKTRRRHRIGAVLGGLAVAAVLGLVVWKLDQEGQVSDACWAPFQNSGVWQNTLLPGLWFTVRAAVLAIALAIVCGMLLCAARLSDHAFVRIPGGVIIEFFRACPLLLLILFFYLAFGKE